jgi:hypothetical protein
MEISLMETKIKHKSFFNLPPIVLDYFLLTPERIKSGYYVRDLVKDMFSFAYFIARNKNSYIKKKEAGLSPGPAIIPPIYSPQS